MMLDDVRQRLRDHEVRRSLDVRRVATRRHLDVDDDRTASGQRLDRGPEPAVGEDARMHAGSELPQFRQPVAGVAQGRPEQVVSPDRIPIEALVGELERDEGRHQPLLCPIVQVAGQPAPRVLHGRNDARPARHQLGVGGGVGDRGRDELGEARDTLLRAGRKRNGLVRAGDERTPDLPLHDHRRPDLGPHAERSQPRGKRPAEVSVSVDPPGSGGPLHQRVDGLPVQREPRSGRDVDAAQAPPRDRHVDPVRGEVGEVDRRRADKAAGLRAHGVEHRLRRGRLGHQGGHPPQRGLLLGNESEIAPARGQRTPVPGLVPLRHHRSPAAHRRPLPMLPPAAAAGKGSSPAGRALVPSLRTP